MKHCLTARLISLLLFPLFSLSNAASFAQPAPVLGQPGKDVVWIPSPNDMVEKMLDMAKVTPDDLVVDLGSGDGRNVIAAAKRGARALGVEYDPGLVEVSRRNAAAAGVADRVTIVQGDMFEADISKASVLILFLIPDNLRKLAPKFRGLAPGTRIVSHAFDMDEWKADRTETVEGKTVYFWLVPLGVLLHISSFACFSQENNALRL